MLQKPNFREYENKQNLLFPPMVGDYLPSDHLAHVIDEAVDAMDLTTIFNKASTVGNPAYHPRMMVKVWFYGYVTGICSSRKIWGELHTDIAFLFLSGMQKPDHRTISDFRKNNIEELKELFMQILEICHKLGMIKVEEISIDSAVMKANASASRSYDKKRLYMEQETLEKAIEEYLRKTNETDQKEDQKYGTDKTGNELPEEISNKETRIKKIRFLADKIKEAKEKLRKSKFKKINLTDEDAQFQQSKGWKVSGYRGQIAVDSKKQIIVAKDVSAEIRDSVELMSMIKQTMKNIDQLEKIGPETEVVKKEIKVCADGGYGSGKNFAMLEREYKNRIDPYINFTKGENVGGKGHSIDSPFHSFKFKYIEEEDCVICPLGGKLLLCCTWLDKGGNKHFVYKRKKTCKNCKYLGGACTTNKFGRTIHLSEYHRDMERMRMKLESNEGQRIYSRRKTIVEPVIGNMKQNIGYKGFLLRGLRKVRGEFALMCIGHNLAKIGRFVRDKGTALKYALSEASLVFEGVT